MLNCKVERTVTSSQALWEEIQHCNTRKDVLVFLNYFYLVLFFNRQGTMQRENNPSLSLLCILLSGINDSRYLSHATKKDEQVSSFIWRILRQNNKNNYGTHDYTISGRVRSHWPYCQLTEGYVDKVLDPVFQMPVTVQQPTKKDWKSSNNSSQSQSKRFARH